jgi:hypothetical protein
MLSFTSAEGAAYTVVFAVASALSGLGGAAAAVVPLAAGLHLVTTRAFTAVETALLRRGLPAPRSG